LTGKDIRDTEKSKKNISTLERGRKQGETKRQLFIKREQKNKKKQSS